MKGGCCSPGCNNCGGQHPTVAALGGVNGVGGARGQTRGASQIERRILTTGDASGIRAAAHWAIRSVGAGAVAMGAVLELSFQAGERV